jgi:hypothetical protein
LGRTLQEEVRRATVEAAGRGLVTADETETENLGAWLH